MFSGFQLRNIFNLNFNSLYNLDSSKKGTGYDGFAGGLKISYKTYIQIFFERSHDLLDVYDKIDSMTNGDIKKFVKDFVAIIKWAGDDLDQFVFDALIEKAKIFFDEIGEEYPQLDFDLNKFLKQNNGYSEKLDAESRFISYKNIIYKKIENLERLYPFEIAEKQKDLSLIRKYKFDSFDFNAFGFIFIL